ncbi:MAG: bifunctional 3,4-dihydroxy-2-butanone-4-phosphate synthase/GTP cyclohydrolase II [Ardenticatenaceae bacterium]|nr:bifunctional 3,4-dihydroxy-2-butanone-4-phosphate synthase/GTP cyclohydrolase II [Ardenticatenaceae bacterium]
MSESIERAVETIRGGGMVVVVDDEGRENEGDLVVAAERVTPEAITVLARRASGLICLALAGPQLDRLGVPMMVPSGRRRDAFGTAYTVTIEAAHGVTTGISAADRARTIRVASDPSSRPEAITIPGHIQPLRARDGGVLARPGHTEAAVDLARLAGLWPAGVICEMMDDDGTMMRLPRLREFARVHGLPLLTIADLITYRRETDCVVERIAASQLPTARGEFTIIAYLDRTGGQEHLALVMGEVADGRPPLVRVHSECLTGEVFGSQRCDCGAQLDLALSQIAGARRGILLYLRQEGRGIGLGNKLRAYALQDQGLDTVEANERLGFSPDPRNYQAAAAMLRQLGVHSIRLLTNNPRKLDSLVACGIEVVERVPLEAPVTPENQRYLHTKRQKLGHLLSGVAGAEHPPHPAISLIAGQYGP